MIIKATTFNGEDVQLKVTDCPVRINNTIIVLANVRNSDTIQHCSIRREKDGIEEFSYVFTAKYKKFVGYVVMKDKRFIAYSPSEEKYYELEDSFLYRPCGNLKFMDELRKVADPITFEVAGEKYSLKQIIGSVDKNKIVLYTFSGHIQITIKDESEVIYE